MSVIIRGALAGGGGNKVKSIQRGYVNGKEADADYDNAPDHCAKWYITLNTVNPDKCFVILNNSWPDSSNKTFALYGLTANRLTVYTYGISMKAGFSWQVVEFD